MQAIILSSRDDSFIGFVPTTIGPQPLIIDHFESLRVNALPFNLLQVTFRLSFKFIPLFITEILLKPKPLTKMLTDRQTDGQLDIVNL